MSTPPAAVRGDTDLTELAALFTVSSQTHLPVTDDDGAYVGVLAAVDVMNSLAAGETTTARALAAPADPVGLDAPISDVLRGLERGAGAVPAVDSTGAVVGWVRHRDLLAALSRGALADAPPQVRERRASIA
ncbi:MAG: CBS domain-containing protein [Jatrophihabitans endophyticus]|nr:CBS domain-containing protein [Jatrophihabitans endophyticus]